MPGGSHGNLRSIYPFWLLNATRRQESERPPLAESKLPDKIESEPDASAGELTARVHDLRTAICQDGLASPIWLRPCGQGEILAAANVPPTHLDEDDIDQRLES